MNKYILLIVLLFLVSGRIAAQSVTVDAKIDSLQILIGEQAKVQLQVAMDIGGLDPSSTTARFTVVDWKTGRRPTKPDDITRKLAQLDMYRLLLAAVEGVELDSIDATLYYVSEPDEGLRELHARAKTKQEILTELSSGIPEQSDND